MSVRNLIFEIFAVDRASAAFDKVGTEAERTGKRVKGASGTMAKAFKYAGLASIAAGALAVKSAADYQTLTTKLVTTAGESQKNLGTVSKGLLDMAGKVGYTADQLATGMYTVESAGFHGAAGLKVMESAAKGARIEGADLTDVTNELTSAMVDYKTPVSKATQTMNTLIAATAHGKLTFQELAQGLPNVAATASVAHIHLDEVATALATLTQHGIDASKAGTYLRQTIGQLQAPSGVATKMMSMLGINANKVALAITSGSGHGLSDAINMLYKGIANHLTPSGLDLLNMMRKLPAGSKAFNDQWKTFDKIAPTGALAKMVGGVRSLQGILMLGGQNAKSYADNLAAVRKQVSGAGNEVGGYAEQQKTLNGQLSDAKGAVSAFAVNLGTDLLPQATATVGAIRGMASWMEKNRTATKVLAGVIISLAGAYVLYTAAAKTQLAVMALYKGASIVYIAATQGMTAAQVAMDGAMDANPIGLVVIAIAALAAGLIYAYKHSKTFRTIVQDTFKGIGAAGRWLWNDVLEPVFHFIVEAEAKVAQTAANMVMAMSKVPGMGWLRPVANMLSDAAGKAQMLADNIKKIPSHKNVTVTYNEVVRKSTVSKVDKQLGGVPHYATGHITNGPELAVVGDNPGGREAIVPMSGPNAVPLGGVTINLTVNGAMDANAVGRQLVQILRNQIRIQGGVKVLST